MRDPSRIPIIVEKLKEIWLAQPDLRFGQLTYNIFSQIPNTRKKGQTQLDMFNIEDEVFEKHLDWMIDADRQN
ncbi:MAG: hypothetical protein ABFD82_08195 [Syntrophaceae bacterium]